MTDFLLFLDPDGGNIEVIEGEPTLTDGPESAAILSLFGGNTDDAGLSGTNRKQWWANFVETDDAKRLRSRTQFLLNTIPANSGNLARIEDAMRSDLAWMVDLLAAVVTVSASIPTLGRVLLSVSLEFDGKKTAFKLSAPWK